jgi:hypothetical protein
MPAPHLIYPQLDGVKIKEDRYLPFTLIQGIRKAYDYLTQLFKVTDSQQSQIDDLKKNSVTGAPDLVNPNVVTKVGAAGTIVEGGITDESAASSDRVRITAVGNIGIANPLAALPDTDPATHLVVGGPSLTAVGEITAAFNTTSTNNNVGVVNFANYNTGAAEKRIALVAGATDGATNSGRLVFYTWNAGTSAERMRITATGNVGIGVTNPLFQEHVVGPGQSGDYNTAAGSNTGGALFLQDSGAGVGNGGIVIFGAAQGSFAGIKGLISSGSGFSQGELAFYVRTSAGDSFLRQIMRIDAAGNIVIPNLRTTDPGPLSKQLWCDTTAGNVVKWRA